MIQRCPCLLRWPIDAEQDSFCGFCGRRLRSVEWKIDCSSHYFVGCEEVDFTLTLYNTGILPVELTGLEWYPSGEKAYLFSEPVTLCPEHPYTERIHVAVPPPCRFRSKLLLKIKTNIPYRTDLVEIELQNKPHLEIVTPSDHAVILVEVPEKWEYKTIPLTFHVLDADIELKDSDPVRLVSRDESIAPLSIFLGPTYEKVWNKQREVQLQIEIPRRFFAENSKSRQVDVCLEVEPKQGGPIRSGWFTLRLCLPLRLDLHLDYVGLKKAKVLKGDRNRFRFILEKKGTGGLTIRNLTLHLPWVLQESGLTSLIVTEHHFPLFLMGVYTEFGWLELDASHWKSSTMVSTPIRFELEMEDGRKDILFINAEIINPVSEKTSPLAIDFGNTNTAVAAGNQENIPEVVNLGSLAVSGTNQMQAISPTLVYYEPDDFPNGRDRFWDAQTVHVGLLGKHADDLRTKRNPLELACIAAAFKPHLGMNRDIRFAIMPNIRKTVESVTADYLRAVLKAVVLETGKEHRTIVITHPVRFWSSQRESLRNAVLQAVNDSQRRILFLDEASAVVLYDTYKRITSEKADLTGNVENVLVFDFGGGSVDLTLCQVTHLPHQRWQIVPIIYDGTNNFGGDRITRVLAEYFHRQAETGSNGHVSGNKEFLKNQKNLKIPFLRWDQIDYTQSPIYIQFAVGNYINTYYRAESFKIDSLSLTSPANVTSSSPATNPITLYYWDEQADTYQEQQFIPSLTGEAIDSLIKAELQKPVQLVRRMLEYVTKGQPGFRLDRVVLSGQSSQLRYVPTLIRDVVREFDPKFAEEKIKRIDEAKEAVSLGAVAYGISERKVDMKIRRLSRTYLFVKRPSGYFGAAAYLPVVQRLDSLPKVVEFPPESFEEPDGLSVRYGDHLVLFEAFCNLADANMLETAEVDEDYRVLAEIPVTPEGWKEEWIEAARVRFTYSQDEQLGAELIPSETLHGTVHPCRLW